MTKTSESDDGKIEMQLAALGAQVAQLMKALGSQPNGDSDSLFGRAVDKSRAAIDTVESSVRKRPIMMMLLAFVLGVLLGRLFVRRP